MPALRRVDVLGWFGVNPEAVPEALRDRDRWLLWDSSAETPRRPHWRGDFQISWNDPADWVSFEEAVEAAQERESWGVGFVFTEDLDLYAIDIDGPKDAEGEWREWFPGLDPFEAAGAYMEWSPGGGIHIPVRGEPPKWWRDCEVDPDLHQGVDVLTHKFCTVTGDTLESSGDRVTDIAPERWLTQVYHRIRGELPHTSGGDHESEAPDGELSREQVEEALSHIDPDLPHGEWIRIGFAVHAWDSGSTGKSVFRRWSRQGSKWDRDAERQVESIWQNATQGSQVTVGTLVHHAKQGGWEPPQRQAAANGGAAASSGGAETPDVREATWEDVQMLFDSDAKGSTTEAYNMATEVLCRDYTFVAVRETGAIYYFDPSKGYYVRKGETFIKELLNEHLGNRVNVSRVRNIREQVVARNYVAVDDFEPPAGKLCVENGVLDLETRELEDYSPDYYFTSRLQSPYDPKDEAERWPEFLEETVAIEGDGKKLEEFLGYTLEVWHHSREKNLFIVGPSRSGKSTFAEVISALFGTVPTVTNLTPQQIADTQFDAASLKEAMLNAVNDINATKIEDTGTLKRVFSGEPLKLERKHEDAHFGAPKAKHLFTANWLPRIVGQDEAFFRRLLIVEFPNQIPESEKDTELADKLKAELPGILNRALDARDRLEELGRFTNDRDMTKTRQMWDSWQDAHKRFLYTQFRITGDSEDTVDRKAYYQAYKEYAARENYEIKPQQSVTKSLKYVPEIAVPSEGDYRGLKWLDVDAAEETEVSQLSLADTQQERLSVVRGIIDDLATEDSGADRESVVETAAGRGFEAGGVERSIDKLLNQGIAYEPTTGELRLT